MNKEHNKVITFVSIDVCLQLHEEIHKKKDSILILSSIFNQLTKFNHFV